MFDLKSPSRQRGLPYLTLWWAVAVCILALLVAEPSLSEQRKLDGGQPAQTDAVLLLDASGSMRMTDPERLRDEGARLFTQFLREGDRLGIIEFSEDAKVIRPLSPYVPGKGEEVFRQIGKAGNSGLYTDILAGIKTARIMLETSLKKGSAGIIILLSDGKHDPDPSHGAINQSMDNLFYSELPELKEQDIKVYTLAFSKQADRELLEKVALATDALSWFTPSSEEIHQSFADLFLAVKKPQIVPLSSKGFKIDGEVKEATFYINNEDSVSEISLIAPSGAHLTREDHGKNIKWFTGKKFDVVTIENPEVGNWQLVGLPKQEAFATVLTDLKLVTDWGGNIVEGEEVTLQARLYEGDRPVVLPEMTGVSNYLLQVIPTDRVSEPIIREVLNDEGKKGDKIALDGIFSTNIRIDTPGEYKVKVLARSPTFERSQQIPFRVKQRLVTLSVVSGGKAQAGGHSGEHGEDHGGHDESHATADHGAEKHGDESEEHGDHHGGEGSEHGGGSDEHAAGGSGDVFEVTLAPEAATFKKLEVELTATDASRKNYKLPLHQSAGNSLLYSVPASVLPAEGSYVLEAALSAQDRNRRTVSAHSNRLNYLRSDSGEVTGHQVELVVTQETKEVEEKPVSLIPSILVILLINFGVGGGCAVLLKRSQSSITLSIPEYEPEQELLDAIAALESRSKQTEVDFEDSRFQTDGYFASSAGAAPSETDKAADEPQKKGQAEGQESGEEASEETEKRNEEEEPSAD